MFFTALIDAVAIIGNTIEGFAGWRYLSSRSYRLKLKRRLQTMPPSKARLAIASLVVSFTFTLVGILTATFFLLLIVEAQSN